MPPVPVVPSAGWRLLWHSCGDQTEIRAIVCSFFGETPCAHNLKQVWCPVQVEKVYLVEQRPPSEKVHFWMNMDQVWVLDRSSKRLDRAPVLWNEHINADTDHTKLILRIRCTWGPNTA